MSSFLTTVLVSLPNLQTTVAPRQNYHSVKNPPTMTLPRWIAPRPMGPRSIGAKNMKSSRLPVPVVSLRRSRTIVRDSSKAKPRTKKHNDGVMIADKMGPSIIRNQRTRNQFRPRAGGGRGATNYQLRQYAEATLGGGSLRKVVKLPEGEDENEWLAVNSKKHFLSESASSQRVYGWRRVRKGGKA